MSASKAYGMQYVTIYTNQDITNRIIEISHVDSLTTFAYLHFPNVDRVHTHRDYNNIVTLIIATIYNYLRIAHL